MLAPDEQRFIFASRSKWLLLTQPGNENRTGRAGADRRGGPSRPASPSL